MDNIIYTIKILIVTLGGFVGLFLGNVDGLILTLISFTAADYVTGVMCGINEHTLSSDIGFRGICRKIIIFIVVGLANLLDVYVIQTGCALRTAMICFYLSNEGISLIENATRLGLPIPAKLRAVLAQINDENND